MARNANITLTGFGVGGDLQFTVMLTTVRPRLIEYAVATVSANVDGREATHEVVAITETSALTGVAQWLIATFAAKAASINREPRFRSVA